MINAAGLQRVITAYITYYMQSRTHLALEMDTPISCPVVPGGRIVVTPHVDGLHHRYDRTAAQPSVDVQPTTILTELPCTSTPKCTHRVRRLTVIGHTVPDTLSQFLRDGDGRFYGLTRQIRLHVGHGGRVCWCLERDVKVFNQHGVLQQILDVAV